MRSESLHAILLVLAACAPVLLSCVPAATAPGPAAAAAPAAAPASGSASVSGSVSGSASGSASAPGSASASAPASASASAPAPASASASRGPSCTGAPGAGEDCNGESCCARIEVPAGEFVMRPDTGGDGAKVRVGAFALDKYEITVGRIRAWVKAGQPLPAAGAALHDDGAGHVVRWPERASVQKAEQLEGWKRYDTWTSGDDRRPKNFLSWYTAAAFCHFDGGRLPTEAEWKYAAVGGEEQRPFPWGAEAPTPERAVFNCMGDGTARCSLADILPVGSRPAGVGRWGHQDLAGSMFEWTITGGTAGDLQADEQASRGGGFCYIGGVDRRAKTELRPLVALRKEDPKTVSHMVGARCAYDVGADRSL